MLGTARRDLSGNGHRLAGRLTLRPAVAVPTLEITTQIDIAASPVQVWSVLTDFSSYPEWNPFIPEISGAAAEGEQLTVKIQPADGSAMTFRPTVLVADPNKELRWLGRVMMPGLFDGEHRFVIAASGDGQSRLEHAESFGGILLPFFRRTINRNTRRGFEAMNVALKARAEQLG